MKRVEFSSFWVFFLRYCTLLGCDGWLAAEKGFWRQLARRIRERGKVKWERYKVANISCSCFCCSLLFLFIYFKLATSSLRVPCKLFKRLLYMIHRHEMLSFTSGKRTQGSWGGRCERRKMRGKNEQQKHWHITWALPLISGISSEHLRKKSCN